MTLINHYQQAFINLTAAKLRSFLAILGIVVGTAAVVALLSCGRLATEKALEQFKYLGTDLMAISLFENAQSSQGNNGNEMTLSMWRQMPEQVAGIVSIAPYSSAYQSISFHGYTLKGAIIGADQKLASTINISLDYGHFLSFAHTFEHHCVIGHTIAQQIKKMTQDNPLGQPIQIGKILYTIIGIAKPWQENSFFNEDINQAIIIPVASTALVNKNSKVNNAIIVVEKNSSIDTIITQTKQFISRNAPHLSIFSRSAKQIITSMESQDQIFTWLLATIGSISLLVGGIGVMNIMLVSVSERKKEIGIRKAVGAKNSEIQALFLSESVVLSFLGGGIGIVLGVVITWIVAYISRWTFTFYFMPPLAGFAVSVTTGIFFGFYPARRAALLPPMVSLRSE